MGDLPPSSPLMPSPPHLWHREDEIVQIQQAYHQQKEHPGRRSLTLLVGPAGIGKTVLAQRALQQMVQKEENECEGSCFFFVRGTFDPLNDPRPMAPIIQAISQLLQEQKLRHEQVAAVSNTNSTTSKATTRFRQSLQHALTDNELQALAGILHPLREWLSPESIVRRTTAVKKKNSDPNRNPYQQDSSITTSRSNYLVVIANLMRAIVGGVGGHSDDIHNNSSRQNGMMVVMMMIDSVEASTLDPASLEVIKLLVMDPQLARHVHVVLAFQPVQVDHPLNRMLQQFESAGVSFCPVMPKPLNASSVSQWIMNKWGRYLSLLSKDTMEGLSQRLVTMTLGNPVALQLVLSDLQRCVFGQQNNVSGNEAALLERRVKVMHSSIKDPSLISHMNRILNQQLIDDRSRRILQAAACLGGWSDVDVGLLTVVLGQDKNSGVVECLSKAVELGIVVPTESSSSSRNDLPYGRYAFVCSTYRGAIYDTVPADEKSLYHAEIGKVLSLKKDPTNNRNATTFRAIAHLQRGYDSLTDTEKVEFSRLTLIAGNHALEWSQFPSACRYFAYGLKALTRRNGLNGDEKDKINNPEAKWASPYYDLSLALHMGIAEACVNLEHWDDTEKFVLNILEYAKHMVERARANALWVSALVKQKRYIEAISFGTKVLQKLGEPIKAHTLEETKRSLGRVGFGFQSKRSASFDDSFAKIRDRPTLHDEKSIEVMKILNLLLGAALLVQGDVLSIAYRMMKITLDKGIYSLSAVAFATLGALFHSHGEVELGTQCEAVSREIGVIKENSDCRGRCLVIENGLSLPRQGFQSQLKMAYRLCNDAGDSEFAMIGTAVSTINLLTAGGPLQATANAMKGVYAMLERKQNLVLLSVIRPFYQMTLNLLGVTMKSDAHRHQAPHILTGNIIPNVDDEIQHAQQSRNFRAEFCIYLAQATLAFYMHKWEECREALERCEVLASSHTLLIAALDVQWCFFNGMSAICLLQNESWDTQTMDKDEAKTKKKYLDVSERCIDRLKEHAAASPDLVQQKIFMLQAEVQVLFGQFDKALELFQQSMKHSTKFGVMSDHALACERAGLALRAAHKDDTAMDYLEDSVQLYREYQAVAKVNHVRGNVIPGWDD